VEIPYTLDEMLTIIELKFRLYQAMKVSTKAMKVFADKHEKHEMRNDHSIMKI